MNVLIVIIIILLVIVQYVKSVKKIVYYGRGSDVVIFFLNSTLGIKMPRVLKRHKYPNYQKCVFKILSIKLYLK